MFNLIFLMFLIVAVVCTAATDKEEIKNALRGAGVNKEQIKNALKAAGYNKEEIKTLKDQALESAEKSSEVLAKVKAVLNTKVSEDTLATETKAERFERFKAEAMSKFKNGEFASKFGRKSSEDNEQRSLAESTPMVEQIKALAKEHSNAAAVKKQMNSAQSFPIVERIKTFAKELHAKKAAADAGKIVESPMSKMKSALEAMSHKA